MEEREYFQMVQQKTEKVSLKWQVYHVITLLVAAVSGLVAEVYFCRILRAFSNNCVLSAKLSFIYTYKNGHANDSALSPVGTTWSSDTLCQFCSIMWITSFIIGMILIVFFFACGKGGEGYVNYPFSRPWRLVCSALVISLVMVVNMLIATGVTIIGLGKFCEEFEPKLKTKECTDAIDMYTDEFPNRTYEIANSISIVNKSTALTTLAWILFGVLTLIRICVAPDFSLLLIKVKTVSHKKSTEA